MISGHGNSIVVDAPSPSRSARLITSFELHELERGHGSEQSFVGLHKRYQPFTHCTQLTVHSLSNSANGDSNNVSPRTAAVGTSFSQNLPSSSARRMVPRNELELSRPAIARAEKDGDDPSSSSSRRRLPPRGHSSTPVTLTRLFAVQAPTSPTQSRAGSFYKRAPGLSPSTTSE